MYAVSAIFLLPVWPQTHVGYRFSPAKHARRTIVTYGLHPDDRPTLDITTSGHSVCPCSTPTTPSVNGAIIHSSDSVLSSRKQHCSSY